ncbi:MAG: hypothetical protein IPJ65_43600 [Archangiaceae bacterium]|nr:hypothetical protein [Archangiaceae bacterium]
MATVNGKKYLDQTIAEIKVRTAKGERSAVAFDVDNTLVDTRRRALALGKAFDKEHGTAWFKNVSWRALGNDAKETALAVNMSPEDTKKFSSYWFRNFQKGELFKNDTQIRQTIALAKRASAAGADVFYVTARTESEEPFTIAQLQKAHLPNVDSEFVVSKAKFDDDTPKYKAGTLDELSQTYDFVPWFITESRSDIHGVQRLQPPVQEVLLETRFSGTAKIAADTPIWPVDVK